MVIKLVCVHTGIFTSCIPEVVDVVRLCVNTHVLEMARSDPPVGLVVTGVILWVASLDTVVPGVGGFCCELRECLAKQQECHCLP